MPSLNGDAYDWSSFRFESVKTIIVWVTLVVIILYFLRILSQTLQKILAYISAGMTMMLFITVIALIIANDGFKLKNNLTFTNEYEFEMSDNNNFIILVLDRFDAEYFNEVLGVHPEYREALRDFTYYDNAVCAYPITDHAIPQLLTGEWYENKGDYAQFVNSAIDKAPIIQALEKQSYCLNLYDAELPIDKAKMNKFHNIIDDGTDYSSYSDFVKVVLKMALLKYVPYNLKVKCYDLPKDVANLKKHRNVNNFVWDDYVFDNNLQQKGISITSKRVFKFIHLEGAHSPYRYRSDLTLLEDENGGNYYMSMEAAMTMTMRYLSYLKENNVYENSVIVIMGGSWGKS